MERHFKLSNDKNTKACVTKALHLATNHKIALLSFDCDWLKDEQFLFEIYLLFEF